MLSINRLFVWIKLFHARLQQECRCLASWTELGITGCVGLGGCIAFALSALAAILLHDAGIGTTFSAGGIGLTFVVGVLAELFVPDECDEQVKEYRLQLQRLLEGAANSKREQIDFGGSREYVIEGIQEFLRELAGVLAIIIIAVGYITCGILFVLFIVATVGGAMNASPSERGEFMENMSDARGNSQQSGIPDPGPEAMGVVGGIVLFIVLPIVLMIAFNAK